MTSGAGYIWRWNRAQGQVFALLLPHTDTVCLQVLLNTFAAAHGVGAVGSDRIGLVLDNRGTHRSRAVRWPDEIQPLPLPAYSPELNPVERCFQQLRARLANRIFEDVIQLDDAITAELQDYWTEPARLKRLTGYRWWLDGVTAIQPSAS